MSSRETAKALPTRQLLSCIPCRKRKVKCDRTKPCFACCARGGPSECQFVVVDGSDYDIIQQSYEIRSLRSENRKLKEQLLVLAENHIRCDSDVEPEWKRVRRGEDPKRRLTEVGHVKDGLSCGASTLVELMESQLVSAPSVEGDHLTPYLHSAYPFPSLRIGDNTPAALTALLPPRNHVIRDIKVFHTILQTLAIPQLPDSTRTKEVQDFLFDIERNATKEPGMLALIFSALALVLQESMGRKEGQYTASGGERIARRKCYMAASMEALRHASFLNEPDLLGIKSLLIMGLCLIKSAQLEEAWTMFGMVIRMAYSIGLHRDPDILPLALSPCERAVRRSVWWATLRMDQNLSTMLCRPLGIPDGGSCAPPRFLSASPVELRLGAIIIEFTTCTREILSFRGCIDPDKIAQFTRKLLCVWHTMPETLRFGESWFETKHTLPEWPLDILSAKVFADIQALIILLNNHDVSHTLKMRHQVWQDNVRPPACLDSKISLCHSSASAHSRSLVINGCVNVMRVFLFLYRRRTAVLVCHLAEQQALNAAMILVADATGTRDYINMPLLEKVQLAFIEMQQLGESRFGGLAVERLSAGLRHVRIQQTGCSGFM